MLNASAELVATTSKLQLQALRYNSYVALKSYLINFPLYDSVYNILSLSLSLFSLSLSLLQPILYKISGCNFSSSSQIPHKMWIFFLLNTKKIVAHRQWKWVPTGKGVQNNKQILLLKTFNCQKLSLCLSTPSQICLYSNNVGIKIS